MTCHGGLWKSEWFLICTPVHIKNKTEKYIICKIFWRFNFGQFMKSVRNRIARNFYASETLSIRKMYSTGVDQVSVQIKSSSLPLWNELWLRKRLQYIRICAFTCRRMFRTLSVLQNYRLHRCCSIIRVLKASIYFLCYCFSKCPKRDKNCPKIMY